MQKKLGIKDKDRPEKGLFLEAISNSGNKKKVLKTFFIKNPGFAVASNINLQYESG